MRAQFMLVAALLAVPALAGCLSGDESDPAPGTPGSGKLVPVQDRHELPYNVTAEQSKTLTKGLYGILDGIAVDIPVSLPATEGGDAAAGRAAVNLGLFLPDIEGCDWTAASLPDECKVPVIADAGPYYSSTKGLPQLQDGTVGGIVGEGDTIATEPAHRLGGFLIENFVPQGYAVAQVSVFGTGDSTHCQDLMGTAEQLGVVAAVEWLGSQPWSNGAVGLIGRSYDGSTPWEAAMHGPEALKTIVPISGLVGQHDLMWRNGSAETRGPGVLYALYAAMTVDGEAGDATQAICPDYILGGPQGGLHFLTGDASTDAAYDYWNERRFLQGTLDNYNGSVYLIHGLQDWNVDNSQAFPTYNILRDAGYDVKGLFGQWAHNYPDRLGEHKACDGNARCGAPESVRYDWAQDLLEWFDHYLKGTGPQPALHAEVQDDSGLWRIVDGDYPSFESIVSFALTDAGVASNGPTASGLPIPVGPLVGPDYSVDMIFPAFSETEPTRISGNIRMPLVVTPTGPGGQIGAYFYDAGDDERYLGHAIMDLRFAAGGDEAQQVAPGVPITAYMESFVMDVVLEPGSELRIVLQDTVEDYLPSTTTNPVQVNLDASMVHIPVVTPSANAFFVPPVPMADIDASDRQP